MKNRELMPGLVSGYVRPGIVLVVLALTLAVSACVAERRIHGTPEAEPTISTQSTPTPELTASPTPVPSPSPSATPEPTAEPDPTPTPESTPDPAPTPTREPRDPPYPLDCEDLTPEIDEELQGVVEDRLGEFAAGFSVVIQELTTGARAEAHPENSYYGASLYKAAVMYEVMRQVSEGELSLNQYLTIDSFYASQDLGTLGAFGWGAGSTISLYEALEASIIVSDNATAYLLGDLVNWVQVDNTLHNELGATDTQFSWETLPTTAGDMALLLKAIACADGVTEENSQMMLDFLANQYIDNRLPRYLPSEAIIGHKTGNWSDVNHDIGIVYGPNAVYVIAVLSQYPGADERIALLSRDVYAYFHPDAFEDDLNDDAN